MAIVSEKAKEWCYSHPSCKNCPFAGSECVALVEHSQFDAWVDKMNRLIASHS